MIILFLAKNELKDKVIHWSKIHFFPPCRETYTDSSMFYNNTKKEEKYITLYLNENKRYPMAEYHNSNIYKYFTNSY